MKMIELTKEKFEEFANNNKYYNFCQTENYALAMRYNGFEHIYVAYTTNDLEILAAGMFLIKIINNSAKYVYCPKGFIIDYENTDLVRKFSKNIVKYFKRKHVFFLKTNPEFTIAKIDYNNDFKKQILPTNNTLLEMKKVGYMRRKETYPFELLEPKLSAIINLKDYDYNKLTDIFKRKIKDRDNKGFEIEIGNSSNIEILANFSNPNLIDYYKHIYEEFSKDNLADLILLKINYENYLISAKKKVEKEEVANEMLNKALQKETNEINIEKKMQSDKLLEEYKQEVIFATNGLKNNQNVYIAAALIIKFKNKITFLAADINKDYAYIEPEYYLYNKILEMYKEKYEYADLYGIANDFNETSKYKKINEFKFGFNPIVYEYAGELDIIINKFKHKLHANSIAYSKEKKIK